MRLYALLEFAQKDEFVEQICCLFEFYNKFSQ
jgi:hypothetical protein